jgi:hypothetical protein
MKPTLNPPGIKRLNLPKPFKVDYDGLLLNFGFKFNLRRYNEVHDGVNYTRTACVIAVARARETFEPYVHQLGFRLAHIARRLLPVAMYLLQKEAGAYTRPPLSST